MGISSRLQLETVLVWCLGGLRAGVLRIDIGQLDRAGGDLLNLFDERGDLLAITSIAHQR